MRLPSTLIKSFLSPTVTLRRLIVLGRHYTSPACRRIAVRLAQAFGRHVSSSNVKLTKPLTLTNGPVKGRTVHL